MRNVILAVIVGITSFTLASINIAQTCDLDIRRGTASAEFDSIFTQDGPGKGLEPSGIAGWTGADSTYSTELPNGDSAFFFSDTYIGESPETIGDGTVSTDANGLRTRDVNCGPPICDPPTNLFRLHNSIVVRDKLTGVLTTLTGPKDINGFSTSFFVPPAGTATNHWYWMGDSVVVQTDAAGTKRLWVFLLEFDSSWTYYGSAIAQVALPSMQLEMIQPLGNMPTASNVNWGSALWLEGEFGNYTLYIYGIKSAGIQKRPHVAKTSWLGSLFDVANMLNWQAWDGYAWQSNIQNSAPIIGNSGDLNNAADSISDEFSVKKLRTTQGSAYVLVGMDTTVQFGAWKDITLYTACHPQGPYSAKTVVYSTPETGSNIVPGMSSGQTLRGNMFTYNPHMHPQFTSKRNLLISYNINAGNSGDLLFADTYRPRFIRVPIRGLQ